MKKNILLLMGLLMSFITYSQSWDYVNYEDGSNITAMNATIDESDNVYTYGDDVGYTRVLRRFDTAGNLQWTKDVSSLLNYMNAVGEGGMEYKDSNIYVVGANSASKATIVRSGISGAATPTAWDELSGSNSRVLDIRIKGDFLYVVGHFGKTTTPTSTISFFDGTTLTGNRLSTYIAKYSILPTKALVWAKKIDASNITRGNNIDVDNDGNTYITGEFRGTSIFYDGATSHIFTSTSATWHGDAFLAKFNSSGNFNSTFGLKIDPYLPEGNFKKSYDVEVSDTNNAVYWAEDRNVLAYNKNGTGSHLWTRNLAPKPYSIETNTCGDIYVTGATYDPVNKSSDSGRAPCGYTFFSTSLNNTSGTSVWSSNSTSCSSFGSEALMDSNKKEILVGTYFTSGVSTPLTIESSYASGGPRGYFIGRYNDTDVNNCCSEEIAIDIPKTIYICESNFEEICAPAAPAGNTYSYEWWGPHPTLPISSLLSTSMCFTPTQYGSYKLEIVDINGCSTFITFTVKEEVGPAISINDVFYCDTRPPSLIGFNYDPIGDVPYRYSYQWTFNGNPIGYSGDHQIPNQGDGEYCVTINWPSNTGWCSSTTCFVVQQCCKPDPSFNTYFSASPTANNLVISNIPAYIPNYEEEIYKVYRKCPGSGAGWVLIHTETRTGVDMNTPISLTVDHTCMYRIQHIINQKCMQKSFLSTVYINETRKITVAPNPVKDHFKINIENFKTVKDASVKVLDSKGIVLFESSVRTNDYKVDVSKMRTGLYFCKILIDGKEYMKKIIKQ